ncbi:dihydroneopterin aldolase [Roseibium hamelinense]|uniref:dihydroneopterin aldolase n=1 Tax=Roseibium hamelinense TaxID=150831 RepID=A0A562SPK6_9HYPH|nr:dihydroneopterin aldolase [Roseibium hamelinense]MTI44263.1 dihydroneopterin aldolase [Roseibium hamelinense]TWI82964.1 dihydroneopterin aldolase [Roseibium hamelinense]
MTKGIPPSSVRADDLSSDEIVIENLLVDTHIGVLDSEKGRTQKVCFNVSIRTVPGYAETVRDTGAYVSYADTVLFIEEKARFGAHVELVETWAEDVAAFVLRNPLAEEVSVRVTKSEIFQNAQGVGISIRRRRTAP